MTSHSMKLLAATTALVATAAASANAGTISTATSTTLFTSNSTPIIISGTGSVIVTGGNGIEISSTNAASNTIQINTGGILRSTSTSILSTNAANAAVVINNSGTIAAISGSTAAIDLSGMSGNATITNAGTISGSITFGDGTNGLTSTGTTSGTITGGTSADSVTLTGATHTGLVTLGAGANGLTVSNSTFIGNYTGGANVDTVNIKDSSVFTGNIATAAGADNITVSNSRVNGNITSGNGLTTMVLTNATISGTITDSQASDSDVLTINGQNTFNQIGAISGFETVNVNTNAVLTEGAGAISGANALTLAAAKTLTVNNSLTLGSGGTLTNNGTLNVAAGKTINADTFTIGAGSSVGIGISDSTHAGKLIVANGLGATSMTINLGNNAGYIASGTSFTIVDGGATSTNATILNSNTGVYRFSTARTSTNQDISLTITRVGTDSVVTGEDNKSVAAALDTVTANTNAALKAVHSEIGKQSTAADVNNIVESLTPSIDGAGAASVNVTVDTGNQISNRLASVRGTGIATGDAMASQHMWLQGFGSSVSQDDKGGNRGYDASAGGVSLGVDTDTLLEGYTTGLAFSYGHASVDSNASSSASTDIDSYVGTLYGSRVFDGGVFVNGQVGGGYNKYDMERNVIGVGKATGNTNGFQGTAKLETGKDFAADGFTLTPLASLQYTYLNMDKYTETGAGGASLTVNPDALNAVDAGVGGQVAYAIPLNDGGTLKPTAHAKYIYHLGDRKMGTTSSFTGGGASFNTSGVEADRSSVNLGAGLLLTTVAGTDLSVNYDADIRSNLIGHTGQLKARWAF